MARARNKLTSKGVDALTGAGRHSDGGGLYLAIDGEGATQRRRWLYLYQWGGKRREMGLRQRAAGIVHDIIGNHLRPE